MNLKKLQPRLARALVLLLAAGFIQTGISAPAANAAAPIKPTITAVTSDAGTITVTMATSGIDATQWRWSLTRRQTFGCDNSYMDGQVQTTGSLSSSINIYGTTEGCRYLIKVAGYNGVIGEYAEYDEIAGGATNGLNIFVKSETGLSTGMTRTPLDKNSSGICNLLLGRVNNIDIDYGSGGPTYCPVNGFTSYYIGYIKAPYTGAVTFRNSSDDGFILNIQGQNVIEYTGDGINTTYNSSGTINMVANEIYRFEAWHHENEGGAVAKLFWDWSGKTTEIVPQANFATDPTVFFGTCPLGSTAQCAAGSAMEIKRATGTNMDGQYWIMVNGVPTLTYCIMNSVMSGGGWMLAMKGKETSSVLDYGDTLWTDTNVLNANYPQRWKNNDPYRDTDAKFGVFAYAKGNQIMALFPEQTGFAGGAISAGTTGNTSVAYGFSWIETTTSMRPWSAYNAGSVNGNPAGWGGTSYNVAHTGGPTATPTCVNVATTLTNLFSTASRCAFRQVQYTYNASESPYSAIGQDLFYAQDKIRFFGINYGSANTGNRDRARFGFGWNENEEGNEGSSDGTSGIGIDRQGYSTITTGSINNCCDQESISKGQTGLSGPPVSSQNIAFEMYVRNSTTGTINGYSLRVTSKRISSLTAANGYSVSGSNGSNTFRLSPIREGFNIDPTNGKITVSEQIPVGDYSMSVTSTDSDGVVGVRAITIQVLAESSETDTALAFNGTSQYVATSGTYGLWGDQTYEAWVKPTSACSQSTGNNAAIGSGNFVLFCKNSYWYISFMDNSDSWTEKQTSLRVINGDWVHLAVVRSGTTVTFFANNSQVTVWSGSSWVNSYTQTTVKNGYYTLYVGGTGYASQYFNGMVDEVKVWSSARTLTQIWNGAQTQENVSQENFWMYWDFNEGTGSALSRAQLVDNNFNLTPSSSSQWVPVAETSKSGPYTVVEIPRTLIGTNAGWRAPESITAVSVLLLGGGGGGGGGYQGGGGGAGGFIESKVSVSPKTVYPIRVGVGGRGFSPLTTPLNGDTSTAFGLSAAGGGSGMVEFILGGNNTQQPAGSGGSGGGASHGTVRTAGKGIAGQGYDGGYGTDLWPTCSVLGGSGGGGAAGTGFTGVCNDAATGGKSHGGNGGIPRYSSILSDYVAGGGGGSLRTTDSTAQMRGLGSNGVGSSGGNSAYINAAEVGAVGGATDGAIGTGGGGGAGSSSDGLSGYGGNGGSGTITLRYITNLKPTFTAPTIAYLNAGMTETFSVNVAQDSETVMLTRTFRWESSTTGANGTFSLIKQGTGAANASFSWVPPDTSTTGNNYLYRVIVTDSDTAGLFIQDTSTAVYAVINGALKLIGKSSLSKTVNISKTETFTVSSGSPTYRYTLIPDGPNFWLDTSTVGSPRIRFLDTATVGTYYETLTVIDSVSASVSIPLTIRVSPPPSFSANSEQVDSGTVLYLDAGNTSSYPGTGSTWNDISGRGLRASFPPLVMPTQNSGTGLSCTSPSFSANNLGSLVFNGTSTCGYVPNLGIQKIYTYEVWFKRSGAMTDYSSIIASPWAGLPNQIAISLHWVNSSQLQAGVWNGSSWGWTTPVTIADQTWTFAAVTFTGSSIDLSLNGVTATKYNAAVSITWNDANNDTGLLIGKRFDQNADFFSGAIGSIRIYNRVLSDSEIQQNYNASKGRFLNTQNKQAQSGKYGTRYTDTYTVTAGSETITAAWSNTSLTRIKWDTSTARTLVLTSQESLTPGTYYDTITVSDIYGSSTRIPLTYTIAKADTLTVWIETPTALNYTATNADFSPTLRVSGLVSSDTGTAVSSIKYRPGGTSCATGGVCSVGDIGPGGGVVFITPATSGGNGKYFEAAPFTWAGSDELGTAATYCSNHNLNLGATNVGIGWGETNTNLAKSACLGGAVGKVNSFNLANNTGYSDWFIPSTNEMIELAKVRIPAGLLLLGSNWTVGRYGYWSSTEVSASVQASLVTSSWSMGGTGKSDASNNLVRPVRAFTPCWATTRCLSLANTSKPIDAGTYAITVETLTLTTGDLANYVSIRYETTTVTINRINQTVQAGAIFNAAYPDVFTLFSLSGSGTGAAGYSIVSGGTASGCTADYKKFVSSSVGTCNVQIVRQGDRNYFGDTSTAYLYFMTFVINQPAPAVGSGPTIALSGQTSVQLEATVAPTISGISSDSGTVGSTITITGAGFYFADPSKLSIKFWRNVAAVTYTIVSDTTVTVTVPANATTGRILVTTPNGQAASSTFTVTS